MTLLLSVTGVAAFNAMVYIGLQSTSALNAILLQSVLPLCIIAWVAVLFGERPGPAQTLGILVSLAGVAVIAGRGSLQTLATLAINPGDVWVFAAVVSYAFYSALLRKRAPVHQLSFLVASFALGTLALVPFYAAELADRRFIQWSVPAALAIVYVAIFPSFIAYLTFNRGVELIGAGRAGQYVHLMQVFGTLLAVVFLGEIFHLFHAVGIALIAAGLLLANRPRLSRDRTHMTVRTRFAPSPTGLLHIGGAHTALFNYLFSRHHGGEFLIRMEDTDRQRSRPEKHPRSILESLDWLGLTPDQPPIFQSTRQPRHAEVARQMVETGHAYYCYSTPEELKAMRERAVAEGRHPGYDGDLARPATRAEAPPGVKPAIRLKAPREGDTVVDDLVQGEVRVGNSEIDDMIILRSDGTPTYLHAVVVDDHDMDITHVIRGDDHLTNTFRQISIYLAMGWELPRFAHLPLIHGADGAKLSKRHGAVSVTEFREQGFLPEALCNYLLRLGWGHGDAEILSRDEAIALFDLDGAGRAPSRMDYAKLTFLNGVWLRQADDDRLTRDVLIRLAHRPELALGTEAAHRIRALMPQLKERAKTLVELADMATFLVHPLPLPMAPKAAALLTPENRLLLRDVAAALENSSFTPEAIDASLRQFAEATGKKLGQVAQPLRAALTGRVASPGIDATLAALGREEALARIRAAAV